MSIRFYDEAVVNKIKKWIADPNMVILKPNEVNRLFQITADQNNDKPLTLPLIAISRDTNINLSIPTKRSLSCDGKKVEYNEEKTKQLDAIPIQISYQLDIYTQKFIEGDEYLRNFIFNLINSPDMKIEIPYNNSSINHTCYIRLNPTISDNSDIAEKLFSDQFTRWTLNFTVEDAFIYSIPILQNKRIEDVEGIIKNKL